MPAESAAGALVTQLPWQPIWVGDTASLTVRSFNKVVAATELTIRGVGTPNGLIKGSLVHRGGSLNTANPVTHVVVPHLPPLVGATPTPGPHGAKLGRWVGEVCGAER